METFQKTFEIRWADIDPNRHVRHTAYADYATHVRFALLSDHGFTMDRFIELGFYPVILRDESRYLREVTIGESITVDVRLGGVSPDGSLWRIQHQVLKENGKLAVVIQVEGGWLDMNRRRLTAPPPDLASLFDNLARTADFSELTRRDSAKFSRFLPPDH